MRKSKAVRKIFYILAMCLFMLALPATGLADGPDIRAGSKNFNPVSGVWTLRDGIVMQLRDITIKADEAEVAMYQQTVEARGNMSLIQNSITFSCDSGHATWADRTAYCNGHCVFTDGKVNITSDSGTYNWKSKVATFEGNVVVDGAGRSGTVKYNVITGTFL